MSVVLMFGEIKCLTWLREDDSQLELSNNNNYGHIIKFKFYIKKMSNLIVFNMLVRLRRGLGVLHKIPPHVYEFYWDELDSHESHQVCVNSIIYFLI